MILEEKKRILEKFNKTIRKKNLSTMAKKSNLQTDQSSGLVAEVKNP